MAELLLIPAYAAGYVGFALLALSQRTHWRSVVGNKEATRAQRLGLRIVGPLMLVLACVLAVLRDGAAFGSILAVLVLIAGAATVALTLSWRPQWLLMACFFADDGTTRRCGALQDQVPHAVPEPPQASRLRNSSTRMQ